MTHSFSRRQITPFGLAALITGAAPRMLRASDNREGAVHQLRIYEIFEHNKAAFHARFRDHAIRIMHRYDFNILNMWEAKTEGRTEFVYLLVWPNQAAMNDRWANFMADVEWAEIKKRTAAQHGALVGEIQSRVLRQTSYAAG